ncbi:MAG TPA: TadE family protein [Nevskia sp.]|nr:TadE family protein [Nevskia sp.]
MKGVAQLRLAHRPARLRGATAVEFVLLFPLMFAIAYGGIVYSFIYMAQQAINFAAQQGAQAALAVVPTSNAATTQQSRLTSATNAAQATLTWLPKKFSIPAAAANCAPVAGNFTFEVDFAPTGLFPMVTLPIVGTFPPVPAVMFACAVAYT